MPTVKEKYGFLPRSVWRLKKSKSLSMTFGNPQLRGTRKQSLLPSEYKYSMLNMEALKRIVLYWSVPNDIILAPFLDWGTIALTARQFNRHSVSFDIVPEYVEEAKQRLSRFKPLAEAWKTQMLIKCGDARNLNIKNEKIDLIIGSPPYWSLEKYTSVDGQLSDIQSYEDFLVELYKTILECYRVLKQNKYSAWIVGDFRKDGRLYVFHRDVMTLFEKAGFVIHDIIINELFSPFILGIGTYEKTKIVAKNHEYILVFKKEVEK